MKKNLLPAMYVGRFQPFHLGHLDAIRQILKKEKQILIGIGSALESHTKANPFTAGERYQMIHSALKSAKLLKHIVGIIPIPDINDFFKWVSHVEMLCPPFGNVYTGSFIVKKLFTENGQHKVIPLEMRKKISGTLVRNLIKTEAGKKNSWKKLVPSSVSELLVQWKANLRLK